MNYMTGPIIMEALYPDGSTTKIGSWSMPDEANSNFDEQEDIGWNVLMCFLKGAVRVEVRKGGTQ